jgi:hypothetical protein
VSERFIDQALVGEVTLEGIGEGHHSLLQVEVLLHDINIVLWQYRCQSLQWPVI